MVNLGDDAGVRSIATKLRHPPRFTPSRGHQPPTVGGERDCRWGIKGVYPQTWHKPNWQYVVTVMMYGLGPNKLSKGS